MAHDLENLHMGFAYTFFGGFAKILGNWPSHFGTVILGLFYVIWTAVVGYWSLFIPWPLRC